MRLRKSLSPQKEVESLLTTKSGKKVKGKSVPLQAQGAQRVPGS